eukprot:TRINITY_DN37534_c0_g1_i1.p1 TRINITY_DN37534_c0_g1~~TRINITY_DN37534_c0_g1_i1.p1  ORF type:complete len:403 (+),score=62.71 TRINITY_DN37534_c0_g1_i1:198-1406(+)
MLTYVATSDGSIARITRFVAPICMAYSSRRNSTCVGCATALTLPHGRRCVAAALSRACAGLSRRRLAQASLQHVVASRGLTDVALRPRETAYFVDGSSFLYPEYCRYLKVGSDTPLADTFIKRLLHLHMNRDVDYFAVAFDAHTKNTLRHQSIPDYKSNRPPRSPELRDGVLRAEEFCNEIGVPCYVCPDYEGDDIVHTYASLAVERSCDVTIRSQDKDLMQLVKPGVQMERSQGVLDTDWVRKRWGVEPWQLLDLLALVGDTSDNVRGVPWIGPKIAAQLLQRYSDLETILAAAKDGMLQGKLLGPKRKKALCENADIARAAREAIKLKTVKEVRLPGLGALRKRRLQPDTVASLCEKHGYTSTLQYLRDANLSATSSVEGFTGGVVTSTAQTMKLSSPSS